MIDDVNNGNNAFSLNANNDHVVAWCSYQTGSYNSKVKLYPASELKLQTYHFFKCCGLWLCNSSLTFPIYEVYGGRLCSIIANVMRFKATCFIVCPTHES